jgi:hypothetical protein
MAEHGEHEVYFEFTAIGNVVKVTAIDGRTGIEVSAMGPASAAQRRSAAIGAAKAEAATQAGIGLPRNQHIAAVRAVVPRPWRFSADMVGQAIPGERDVHV